VIQEASRLGSQITLCIVLADSLPSKYILPIEILLAWKTEQLIWGGRMSQSLPPTLRRVRGFFWLSMVMLALLLALSALAAIHFFPLPRQTKESALLSGPAGLALLAIVIAFSAYLRSVSSDANEKREKISSGESKFYPLGLDHTKAKLGSLDGTCEKLQVAASFFILLSVLASFRIIVDDLQRLGLSWLERNAWYLRLADFLILEWLFFALLTLSYFHRKSRIREEGIRLQAQEFRSNTKAGGSLQPGKN